MLYFWLDGFRQWGSGGGSIGSKGSGSSSGIRQTPKTDDTWDWKARVPSVEITLKNYSGLPKTQMSRKLLSRCCRWLKPLVWQELNGEMFEQCDTKCCLYTGQLSRERRSRKTERFFHSAHSHSDMILFLQLAVIDDDLSQFLSTFHTLKSQLQSGPSIELKADTQTDQK